MDTELIDAVAAKVAARNGQTLDELGNGGAVLRGLVLVVLDATLSHGGSSLIFETPGGTTRVIQRGAGAEKPPTLDQLFGVLEPQEAPDFERDTEYDAGPQQPPVTSPVPVADEVENPPAAVKPAVAEAAPGSAPSRASRARAARA